MKKMPLNLEMIKDNIAKMKGYEVELTINTGRNRISERTGIVSEVYSSVFTVKELDLLHTYSYSDVLCGEVKIKTLKV